MKSNEERCVLCIQNPTNSACIVSDAKMSKHCPCKECLVRITCLNPDQACRKYMVLYDQCVRTIR